MYNMLMNGPRVKSSRNQQGFASLVIAMVLVLVLSLITLGFAQLMRKEQRSALDRHLSSQAYYAAEAGINDAAKALSAGYTGTKAACDPLPVPPVSTPPDPTKYLSDSKVDSAGTAKYSCLLIDPAPTSLEFGAIDFSQSKSMIITGEDFNSPGTTAPFNDLVISWQDSGEGNTFVPAATAASHPFFPLASWPATTSVLRVGLTPLNSVSVTRDNMISSTYTAFLYPNANPGAGNAATAFANYPSYSMPGNTGTAGGTIIDGKCNTGSQPRYCNVRISGLDQLNYLLDLRSMAYGKSRVTITAYGSGGARIRIRNAQTLVDSTGKAQDVLRRVQARIPSKNNYDHADYGIDAMSGICKQLQLIPGSSPNNCTP